MTELEDLKNEVLRGIGWNILILQKMEGMLKFIVSFTGVIAMTDDFATPVEGLTKSNRRRRKKVEQMSMGRLVESFSKTLLSGEAGSGEKEREGHPLKIEVSYSFEDPTFVNQLKETLSEVVRDRNNLVHKRLIYFDPSSIESVQELLEELDSQRARIKPQYETLAAIFSNLRDFQRDFEVYSKSESFTDDLKRAMDEQGIEGPSKISTERSDSDAGS